MKTQMKALFLSISALVALTTTVQASEFPARHLDESVLAQVVRSSGFMAPPGGMTTTTYWIKKNGEVVRLYSSPNTRNRPVVIKRISADSQTRLERAIEQIHEGKLVDAHPEWPTGADAPSTSFRVNRHGAVIEVAERGGDFHIYMLRQKAAPVILGILEQAIAE